MTTDTAPSAGQPKPTRRWSRYCLPALLVVVLLAGLGMSWLAVKMYRARQQRVRPPAVASCGRDLHGRDGGATDGDWTEFR
jgi:hypothetical protein